MTYLYQLPTSASDELSFCELSYAACLSFAKSEDWKLVQTILIELARIRRHGISEQELAAARAQHMADAESAYREKDQTYSTVSFCLHPCMVTK